jgi:hypothetical protein
MKKFLAFGLFFALALFSHKTSFCSMVIEGSFKEDVESSHLIIITTVDKIEYAESSPGEIVTKLFLTDTEVVKGEVQDVPEVIFIEGGELGDKKVVILGVPEYEVGQRYIFFLRFDNPICPIIGLGLRSFILEKSPMSAEEMVYDYNYRKIYGIKNDRINRSVPSDSEITSLENEQSLKTGQFVEMIKSIMNQPDYVDISKNIPKQIRVK